MNLVDIQSSAEKLCNSILTQEVKTSAVLIDFSEQMAQYYIQYSEQNSTVSCHEIDCKKGCSYCCNHWVEDVYSFESLAIIQFIRTFHSDEIVRIQRESATAESVIVSLFEQFPDLEEFELLQKFYEQQIPCPLLGSHGDCLVYPVRPLTCRMFYSRSAQRFCKPPVIDSEEQGTFMIPFPESLELLLDEIHVVVNRQYEFPTSLRSMLAGFC